MKSDISLLFQAVNTARHIYHQCHANGTGGSVLPGKVAAEIYPDILHITSAGVRTILVTGTNGKTTTARMISSMLNYAGIKCFSNKEGANILNGIITAYVLNADDDGAASLHTAVIECDELYVPEMMRNPLHRNWSSVMRPCRHWIPLCNTRF